ECALISLATASHFCQLAPGIAMLAFILKRLLHMIPLLVGVSLLTFLLMALAPGDYYTSLTQNPQISPETIARLRTQFHLDKPWYVQYFFWLKNMAHGDFGYS